MAIKVIGFDADDTLWVNLPLFLKAAEKFYHAFNHKLSAKKISAALYQTEMQNLEIYGYGVKSFVLSMIETALKIDPNLSPEQIEKIIQSGKEILTHPIELLDGVKAVLKQLNGGYRLIVATKGDLLDQERKLERSGLAAYFHHIEVMSKKDEPGYRKLLHHLEIAPDEFLMIGNSLKSDILPVLNLGGYAVYVPYHTTWQHERIEKIPIENPRFRKFEKITEILAFLA